MCDIDHCEDKRPITMYCSDHFDYVQAISIRKAAIKMECSIAEIVAAGIRTYCDHCPELGQKPHSVY